MGNAVGIAAHLVRGRVHIAAGGIVTKDWIGLVSQSTAVLGSGAAVKVGRIAVSFGL